jgi:hypothetical protein
MLDTARNLYVTLLITIRMHVNCFPSFPVTDILRMLDAMSWVKVSNTSITHGSAIYRAIGRMNDPKSVAELLSLAYYG